MLDNSLQAVWQFPLAMQKLLSQHCERLSHNLLISFPHSGNLFLLKTGVKSSFRLDQFRKLLQSRSLNKGLQPLVRTFRHCAFYCRDAACRAFSAVDACIKYLKKLMSLRDGAAIVAVSSSVSYSNSIILSYSFAEIASGVAALAMTLKIGMSFLLL